jgi:hypothetical protein
MDAIQHSVSTQQKEDSDSTQQKEASDSTQQKEDSDSTQQKEESDSTQQKEASDSTQQKEEPTQKEDAPDGAPVAVVGRENLDSTTFGRASLVQDEDQAASHLLATQEGSGAKNDDDDDDNNDNGSGNGGDDEDGGEPSENYCAESEPTYDSDEDEVPVEIRRPFNVRHRMRARMHAADPSEWWWHIHSAAVSDTAGGGIRC